MGCLVFNVHLLSLVLLFQSELSTGSGGKIFNC